MCRKKILELSEINILKPGELTISSTLLIKSAHLNRAKGIMQGKSIAVVYTLCTYWNQFSLGGICKQELMDQCLSSIREEQNHLILIILIIHILIFYDQNISLIFLSEDGSHVKLWHPSFVYFIAQRQYTAVQKMCTPLK